MLTYQNIPETHIFFIDSSITYLSIQKEISQEKDVNSLQVLV